MTKTTKLKWRLAERPTPRDVADLLNLSIVSKEEAREILFTEETEEDRDKDSLKSEIKFLRELVEKLSNNQRSTIVETIKYIEKPYIKWNWYPAYNAWSVDQRYLTSANSTSYTLTSGSNNAIGSVAGQLNTASFKNIQTF